MESALDWHAALAALEWQVDLGVTETIAEGPVNRFEVAAEPPRAAAITAAAAPAAPAEVDPVAEATRAADAAADLDALRAAMEAYPHCDLRRGARNCVFADGAPSARLMIVGEAPGREEDLQGRPFVGRAGRLLDAMLAAIGLGRDRSGDAGVYITNVLPWRPPQNRDPAAEEIAMMLPFLRRHVALADPDVLVVMGNISARAVLGRSGITRLRGTWTEAMDRPCLPMFHPAYLLRNPAAKREAWGDLLDLRARLAASNPKDIPAP
ncbi:uracil-DNA glycosylase [Roseivivax isoporae]|uniref:Type-4 uracil-DNA glycosylase n=1 Tax=Roseivivax isoporae LMG 25204 TaxID=1449351 RepID=X7F697_9RHOB|nr:uracil-DNA glycosylase [Roseivivax isoporae]ETX27601.1 uracil-DNA glycosylase [Roseivivax isoporae LMG 25204]